VSSHKPSPILNDIVQALQEFDVDRIQSLTKTALAKNISPLTVIEEGIARGLREIGRQYEEGLLFVTHLVAAAEAARVTIDEILTPALQKEKSSTQRAQRIRPKVVLATVEGDIHDIGKNIVGAMLFAAGFEVIDLGKDVPAVQIVKAVLEEKPTILGLSSLLSTTMTQMRKVIGILQKEGLRSDVKVMVGGGPVTAEWAHQIGADGYGKNATEAVRVAKQLLHHE
jgi:trimethylamine corrinoid protein